MCEFDIDWRRYTMNYALWLSFLDNQKLAGLLTILSSLSMPNNFVRLLINVTWRMCAPNCVCYVMCCNE